MKKEQTSTDQRQGLLATLDRYRATWLSERADYPHADLAEERANYQTLRAFVESTRHCFERSHAGGHITGSALVVSPDLSQVLLTLHGKLNIWLQLGGHADGNPHVHATARREAEEESGLSQLAFLPYEAAFRSANIHDSCAPLGAGEPLPFDLDNHRIPARPTEPAHIHYDVRYLIVAAAPADIKISAESKDLRWFTLDAARQVTDERSMLRQFDKLAWLRASL